MRNNAEAFGLATAAVWEQGHRVPGHRPGDPWPVQPVTAHETGNLPIVYVYPGCRWDMRPTGRHRYLMEAMSAHTRVVFLNAPRFAGKTLEAPRPKAEDVAPNVTLIHDAMGLRWGRVGKRLRRLAARIDAGWIHSLLRQRGIREYIYWVSAPDPALTYGMRTDRMVYDCIDPCFTPESRVGFDEAEFAVGRKATAIFCTAETLLERMRGLGRPAYLLPNACALEEYLPPSDSRAAAPAVPLLLRSRSRPVIGFMGTIDWRLDVRTLQYAAERLPQFTFAIVGRVNADQENGLTALRSLANVVVTGAVSQEEGRAYAAAFDVGLIPFRPGPIGDAINPVKMYMYLATGKPVVCTDCRECRQHAPLVTTARDADAFVAAIRHAVSDDAPDHASARMEFARRNTWHDRASTAASRLREIGLFQSVANVQTLSEGV